MDGQCTDLVRLTLQRELGDEFPRVCAAVQSQFDFDFGTPSPDHPWCTLKDTETDGLASLEELLPDDLVRNIAVPLLETVKDKRQAIAYVFMRTDLSSPRFTSDIAS